MLAKKYACMYLVNVIIHQHLFMNMNINLLFANHVFGVPLYFHKATIKQEQREHIIENSNNNNLQQQICPACKNKSISLAPLAKDEIYRISMEGKRGLEMEFSKCSR
jgi:hypothetical protein